MSGNSRVTPLDVQIAERIKELRIEAEASMAGVANYLGITYQSYQKLERGGTAFRVEPLLKLCDLYGVGINDLMKGRKSPVDNVNAILTFTKMVQGVSEAAANSACSAAYIRIREMSV